MKLPPLGPVRAFEAAGRLLSVRKAARELYVTPAAVSRQIKVLESYLAVRLFHRGHRAVALTPIGKQYLSDISPHFTGICVATRRIVGARSRRVLKIRAYTTFAMRWLIPRLSSFHSSHPDIDVQLTTSVEWVDFEREDIDAAIRLGQGDWPKVHADRLVPNQLLPVCSPSLVQRNGPFDSPENLARETLLHTLARADDWANWLDAVGANEIDAYGGLQYESSVLSYQAAIEGHGFAMAQKVLVESDLAEGRLVAPFEFCLEMGANTYYLVFPINKVESPELTVFRDWLQNACAAGEKANAVSSNNTQAQKQPMIRTINRIRIPFQRAR